MAAPSEGELRAWLELAFELSDEADSTSLAAFRRDLVVSTKPDRTPVTEIDRGIETRLRARILEVFPDHGILGEEHGTSGADASVRWYLDPIDGTSNYIRGIPIFATLIAVEADGELVVGVVSAPALGERWWAARGLGAHHRDRFGNRRTLSVSSVGSIADAQLLYGSAADDMASGLMPGFCRTIGAAWRDRGFGDFWAYMLVAEGAAEAMIETGMSAWDLAAPTVILEEAGGRVSDLSGAHRIDQPTFVASNGLLHDDLLRRLSEA